MGTVLAWTETVRLGYLGLYVVHSVSCGRSKAFVRNSSGIP